MGKQSKLLKLMSLQEPEGNCVEYWSLLNISGCISANEVVFPVRNTHSLSAEKSEILFASRSFIREATWGWLIRKDYQHGENLESMFFTAWPCTQKPSESIKTVLGSMQNRQKTKGWPNLDLDICLHLLLSFPQYLLKPPSGFAVDIVFPPLLSPLPLQQCYGVVVTMLRDLCPILQWIYEIFTTILHEEM